jgi:hypothetical protein
VVGAIDDPNRSIIEHLNARGSREDLVLTNYGQLPIMFHTGMRAVGYGQDLRISDDPNWIIIRQGRPGIPYLQNRARGYGKVRLDARDQRWGGRPDPEWQRLRSKIRVPKLVVHHRLDIASERDTR